LPTRYDRGFFRRDSWPSETLGGFLASPDSDFLNELGVLAGLGQGVLYRPYELSVLAGSDAPPPWTSTPGPDHRPFADIRGLASDSRGNLYFADAGFNVIRKLSPAGQLTTVAGVEWTSWEERDELLASEVLGEWSGQRSASTAVLSAPGAVAVDSSDNVYFSSGRRIFKLTSGGALSVLAGSDAPWGEGGAFDGVGGDAKFAQITAMAADRQGNLYVVDNGTSVRKVTAQGVVTTLAGVAGWDWTGGGYQDGPGAQARFGYIEGNVAVDSRGAIYVADSGNSVIRKIEPDGRTSTYIGRVSSPVHFDAARAKARVAWPRAVAIDPRDNIYFLDGSTLRQVTADGQVYTLLGQPNSNDPERLGLGERARLPLQWPYTPNCLAAAPDGRVYAANYRTIYEAKPAAGAVAGGGAGGGSSSATIWPAPPPPSSLSGRGSLQSLSLAQTSVALSGFERALEISGSYTGVLKNLAIDFVHQNTGDVISASVALHHPTSARTVSAARSLSVPLVLSASTAPGVWSIREVSYQDGDGNGVSLTGADLPAGMRGLAITVTNSLPADRVPPVPVAIAVTPSQINPAHNGEGSAAKPRVRLTVSESSRLNYAKIDFYHPSTYDTDFRTVSVEFYDYQLVGVNGDQKIYEAELRLPADIAEGSWQVRRVSLWDDRENRAAYSVQGPEPPLPSSLTGTIMQVGGSFPPFSNPPDTAAPAASSVEILPSSVNVSSGSKAVAVRVRATDNLSGVLHVYVGLTHSSGGTIWSPSEVRLVEGTRRDGVYEGRLVVPSSAANGSYRVTYVQLYDAANNRASYGTGEERPLTPTMLATLNVSGGEQPPRQGFVSSISVSPSVVDTSARPAEVTIRFSVTGQEQPLRAYQWNGTLGFHSPSGTQYVWSEFGRPHLITVAGDTRAYEVVLRLPRSSERGIWALDYLELLPADEQNGSSKYVVPANLSATGRTPPRFTVLGIERVPQVDLIPLNPPKQAVALTLGNLDFIFDGAEKRASASAPSVGLGSDRIVFTYNGLTTAPIDPGTYQVSAYLDDPRYAGALTGTLTIRSSGPSTQAASADLTGDGQADVLWQHRGTGAVHVWEMGGSRLVRGHDLPVVADLGWRIRGTGDFTGDGRADVLWQHRGTGAVHVWEMDGLRPVRGVDLPLVGDLGWQIGGVADMTGDGRTDIVWQRRDGRMHVWEMNGTAPVRGIDLPTVGDLHWQLAATGDLTGDGKADLVWQHRRDGRVHVWEMNGTTPVRGIDLPVVADLAWLIATISDFTGDGSSDLVWRHRTDGRVVLWEMNRLVLAGVPSWPSVVDTSWQIAGTSEDRNLTETDLTIDGRTDVLWRLLGNGGVHLWEMNGTSPVRGYDLPPVGDLAWQLGGAGDFTGDGKSDILWRHAVNGAVHVWELDGTRLVRGHNLPPVGDLGWQLGGVGDLTGDGQPDILWRHRANGRVHVWRMNGLVPVEGVELPGVGDQGWQIGAVGDLSGDGWSDILWRHEADGRVVVWSMAQGRLAQVAGLPTVADLGWRIGGVGDFTGDGWLDVLWRHSGDGRVHVWRMNGMQALQGIDLTPVQDPNWQIFNR
jgi:hypothetical protein